MLLKFFFSSKSLLRYASANVGNIIGVNVQVERIGRFVDWWKLDYVSKLNPRNTEKFLPLIG